MAGDELTRHLAQQAAHRVSSDDRPRIEFGFARLVGRVGLFDLNRLRTLARRLGADRPPHTGTPIDWDRVAEVRHSRQMNATLQASGDDSLRVSRDGRARLRSRLECYQANAHPRLATARKDLRAFVAGKPGSELDPAPSP